MTPLTWPNPADDRRLALEIVSAPGFRLIFAACDRNLIEDRGWTQPAGFDALCSSGRRVAGGRGPNRILDHARGSDSIRIRPARHGGVLGRSLGVRFLGPGRVLREFRIWTLLRSRGVSLPPAIFAGSRRHGLFWVSHIATLNRPHAVDGRFWLEAQPSGETIEQGAAALGRSLRRLHDAGGVHGDLHLGNLLFEVEEGGALHCWLVDLDRARLLAKVAPAVRVREWVRLLRSLEKSGRREMLTPRATARALSAYCGEDRALRRAMMQSLPREIRRVARHRLAWKFSRRVDGGRILEER